MFPVQTVNYPNGMKEQLVLFGPTDKMNVTGFGNGWYPDGTQIRRMHYSLWSYGVYKFMDSQKAEWKYEIVTPER
jgi:hypothetical protein